MTVHLLYCKIVHHFALPVGNFWLQPVAKMLRHSETTGKPDFLLPPSLHRSKSCSTKFKAWSRNFEKRGGGGGGGGGGVTSTGTWRRPINLKQVEFVAIIIN